MQPVKPEIKQTIKLTVIPEPEPNRAVFTSDGDCSIAFQGYETGLALICGNCSAQLVTGVSLSQINKIVIKCNQCGKFNEL